MHPLKQQMRLFLRLGLLLNKYRIFLQDNKLHLSCVEYLEAEIYKFLNALEYNFEKTQQFPLKLLSVKKSGHYKLCRERTCIAALMLGLEKHFSPEDCIYWFIVSKTVAAFTSCEKIVDLHLASMVNAKYLAKFSEPIYDEPHIHLTDKFKADFRVIQKKPKPSQQFITPSLINKLNLAQNNKTVSILMLKPYNQKRK